MNDNGLSCGKVSVLSCLGSGNPPGPLLWSDFLPAVFILDSLPSSLSELEDAAAVLLAGFRFTPCTASPDLPAEGARSVLLPCLTQAPWALHPNLVSPWLFAC